MRLDYGKRIGRIWKKFENVRKIERKYLMEYTLHRGRKGI